MDSEEDRKEEREEDRKEDIEGNREKDSKGKLSRKERGQKRTVKERGKRIEQIERHVGEGFEEAQKERGRVLRRG